VPDLPATDLFTVWSNGDTLAAGADTVVYLSTNAGATWSRSARVGPDVQSVNAVLFRDGRMYAGTQPRTGVFVSDDRGATWTNFNQGLAGLGSFDITELVFLGDSLYAATVGGSAWVRNIHSGSWSLFGPDTLQAYQAQNMTAIAVGGSRLFALGGFNGTAFYRDPGQQDWTATLFFHDWFAPGLAGLSAIWTGHRWVIGSNIGIHYSDTGHSPWTYVDFNIHPTLFVGFAMYGSDLFASFGAGGGTLIAMSRDDGATWQGVDSLFNVFTYKLARVGSTLYAGRVDGLWRRPIPGLSSAPGNDAPAHLAFAVSGRNPVLGDRVRFAFDLPEPGPIVIDVFDIAGRRVGAIQETRPAGHGEAVWDTGELSAGVYFARLTAAGRHATARLVHVR